MISINNLHARVEEKDILKGLSLDIKPGEVHAIMGPNGAGKSTLGNVLAGRPGYEVTSGTATLNGKDIFAMDTEERAREGVFLAFQYPVEIPGVSNLEFLKASVDAVRAHQGKKALDSVQFLKLAREKCKAVNLDQGFLKLALFGLVKPSDERLLSSQSKINRFLKVKTPKGVGYYRYSFDAYGEENKGRLWPLLGGEHARFAIERYNHENLSKLKMQEITKEIKESFEGFANDGSMIPEQVFEQTGLGTGAATPLAWSHAEYIKLLWSLDQTRNIANPF